LPGTRLRERLAQRRGCLLSTAVRLLEKQGYQVTIAGNGREALRALEQQDFDLVLMDIQMPELNGFEATAAIREKE
jgi:two-component system, sensor histidine kinase and response regulator